MPSGAKKGQGKKFNNYEVIVDDKGSYVLVELTQNQWAKCDLDDWFGGLDQYKWYARYSPSVNSFYASSNVWVGHNKRASLNMHRLVLKITNPKMTADHIYHDTLDNRRSQIRVASNLQNIANSKKRITNTSGHTGVRVFTNKSGNSYWKVTWREDSQEQYKFFPHTEEGLTGALAYRKQQVQRVYGNFASTNMCGGPIKECEPSYGQT